MLKNGGLTEFGAMDMAIKVLFLGKSLATQYNEAFEMQSNQERAKRYSDMPELEPEDPTW